MFRNSHCVISILDKGLDFFSRVFSDSVFIIKVTKFESHDHFHMEISFDECMVACGYSSTWWVLEENRFSIIFGYTRSSRPYLKKKQKN